MIEGLSAVLGGIGFVLTTPRIWLHAAVPALLLIVLSCGLAGVGIYEATALSHWLIGEPETIWGQVGGWLLTVLLALTLLIVALLLALVLTQPLSAFALEAVARAQERELLGAELPHSSFLTALLTSLRATIVMLLVGGVAFTALFVIDLCFPPATLVTIPLRLLFSGWLLAWNFLDYPLSMRGFGVIARLRWAFRHFEEFTVFGVAWASLLIVPGLFLVVLPMGVAGATRLVIEADLADAD